MRILLISAQENLRDFIKRNFMPRGAEIIQYGNPIKAMDNIDEVDPEVVMFSSNDFPRHWKPFAAFLRDTRPREECVFVLLTREGFEQADEAQILGVNGIVNEEMRDKHDIARLKDLISRYRDIGDARAEKRLVPTPADTVQFVFTHPQRMEMIHGMVEDVSATGIAFVPGDRQRTMDLPVGGELRSCSLQLGEKIITIHSTIVRNERALSLRFGDLNEGQRALIRDYVSAQPQRELKTAAAEEPAVLEPA